MRALTASQKKLIDKFMVENTNPKDSFERINSVFTEGRHHLDADDLPTELFTKLIQINDTEILYQEVDRYMGDKSSDIIYKS